MADLTQELAVEKLNDESWTADKIARKARIASRNPVNNTQKSLFRQMAWVNDNKDSLGDLLRYMKDVEVDTNADTADSKFFNAANKNIAVQKLRSAMIANNNNSAYLRLAKTFDYDAADEFQESTNDEDALDEDTAKKLDRIAKKYAAKAEKSNAQPYQKKPKNGYQLPYSNSQQFSMPQQTPYGVFARPNLPNQFPPLQGAGVQFPPMQGMQIPPMQGMQFPPMQGMQFPAIAMQGVAPMQQMTPSTGRGKAAPFKTYSTCKVCKGVGHW